MASLPTSPTAAKIVLMPLWSRGLLEVRQSKVPIIILAGFASKEAQPLRLITENMANKFTRSRIGVINGNIAIDT